MASINISNLNPVGSELFMDSESFMNELTEQELNATNGGLSPIVIWGVAIASEYVIGSMAAGAAVGAYTALKKMN
ncbi:MAG: class IIb bacteriocin, lactobin A/cerein 7B family [Desmonostoc vinosum HA7617-LM4]|jgi:lactobin A/cerein 7B family class IIb bacteriocin|nr:class IIb bacteriocin, lactobin A/cerein 7B family [Desmonostoc vinosum HA7617-LM4]